MIAKLRGILDEKLPGEVVVDVGGVGYHAFVSLSTFCRLPQAGERVALFTVTNLRDNALELFAFAGREERRLFNVLRGVSGIGPRLALAILSGIEAEDLLCVLREGAVDRLVAVPGVGRKTAERLLLELRGKLDNGAGQAGSRSTGVEQDAVAALVTLGYKRSQAIAAVAESRAGSGGELEALIKQSLARLART